MSTIDVDHRTDFWQLLDSRADETPNELILFDDRQRSLTADQWRCAALRVAAALAEQGVRAGTRVLWQLPTTLESAVLTAALARLGAVQMPVITMMREAELTALHQQFDTQLAVAPPTWHDFDHVAALQRICGSEVPVMASDHRSVTGPDLDLPLASPELLPPAEPTHGAERWVYTTSGSTGNPKGVKHTDASLIATANSALTQFGVNACDVFPVAFPLAHIGGASWLVLALRTGCRLMLLDSFSAAETPLVMAQSDATILGSATPFFLAYLTAQQQAGQRRLFPNLRVCMGGGAPIPSDLDARVRRELGGAGVSNGYGLTEFPLAGFPPLDDDNTRGASSWSPGPGVDVRCVDADGHDCVAGSIGELRLAGPQRFAGYLDSDLDSAAIDDRGYVRTGDLARVDENGLVTIVGRLKEIILRGAENISISEVESVLATHPRIADVAVIAVPDPRTGERCCAVVVPVDDSEPLTLADLDTHCRLAGLARYKTPEQLVMSEAIPRNSMGKIARRALVDRVVSAQ